MMNSQYLTTLQLRCQKACIFNNSQLLWDILRSIVPFFRGQKRYGKVRPDDSFCKDFGI